MVIMPISGVRAYSNNYNNIAFGRKRDNEGKTEKEVPTRSTSPMLKSVPVAVVLSMLPMTAPLQAGNNKVFSENAIEYVVPAETTAVSPSKATDGGKTATLVERKGFGPVADGVEYDVYGFIEAVSKGSKATSIDDVKMVIHSLDEEMTGSILAVNDVALKIQGDDGAYSGTLNFKQILFKDDKDGSLLACSRPDMVDYVEAVLKKDNNNTTIVQNKLVRTIKPDGKSGWKATPANTAWMQKDAGVRYGDYVVTSDPIKGTNGTYVLRAYSFTQEDGDPYDVITISKDGSKEMELISVNQVENPIYTLEYLGNVVSDQIIVSKGKYGIFTLLDPILSTALYSLKKDPLYGDAFTTKNEKMNVQLSHNCETYCYSDEEF